MTSACLTYYYVYMSRCSYKVLPCIKKMAALHSKRLRDREGIPCSIMSLKYSHINTKITPIAAVMRVIKDTITLTMDIIIGHHHHGHSGNKQGLLIALCITASIMILEFVGGLWTNSLALLSDSGHMLSDAGSLVLSLHRPLVRSQAIIST